MLGVQECNNINKCYCESGWSGTDCSIETEIPELPPAQSTSAAAAAAEAEKNKNGLTSIMKKNVTPYGKSTFVVQQLRIIHIASNILYKNS